MYIYIYLYIHIWNEKENITYKYITTRNIGEQEKGQNRFTLKLV